ncbi:MAG: hypothetical protein QMD00_03755 [Hadesarchaea archaeon]|nr:hypothetical protein [Hadesarchaea archaeon]
MAQLIRSGFGSFDELIGGGLQSGYPWLLVADREAEGTAVSVASVLSWRFLAWGHLTFLIATRHPWGVSMERYKRLMPDIYRKIVEAGRERRLLVVNREGLQPESDIPKEGAETDPKV